MMSITILICTPPFQTGCTVEVKHPESGQYVEAVVNKVTDNSTYTVGK